MSTIPSRTRTGSPTDVLTALSTGRRRRVVAALERTSPATEGELAGQVVAFESEKTRATRNRPATVAVSVDDERARTIQRELRHVHLPALADVGLVDWNPDDGTASTTASGVLSEDDLRTVVEMTADVWDDLFDALASERRRATIDALRTGGPMTREELAREVAQRTDAEEPEAVLTSLHHHHLPKLADAGLVEYGETVAYDGVSILPLADTLSLLVPESR